MNKTIKVAVLLLLVKGARGDMINQQVDKRFQTYFVSINDIGYNNSTYLSLKGGCKILLKFSANLINLKQLSVLCGNRPF